MPWFKLKFPICLMILLFFVLSSPKTLLAAPELLSSTLKVTWNDGKNVVYKTSYIFKPESTGTLEYQNDENGHPFGNPNLTQDGCKKRSGATFNLGYDSTYPKGWYHLFNEKQPTVDDPTLYRGTATVTWGSRSDQKNCAYGYMYLPKIILPDKTAMVEVRGNIYSRGVIQEKIDANKSYLVLDGNQLVESEADINGLDYSNIIKLGSYPLNIASTAGYTGGVIEFENIINGLLQEKPLTEIKEIAHLTNFLEETTELAKDPDGDLAVWYNPSKTESIKFNQNLDIPSVLSKKVVVIKPKQDCVPLDNCNSDIVISKNIEASAGAKGKKGLLALVVFGNVEITEDVNKIDAAIISLHHKPDLPRENPRSFDGKIIIKEIINPSKLKMLNINGLLIAGFIEFKREPDLTRGVNIGTKVRYNNQFVNRRMPGFNQLFKPFVQEQSP